MSPSYLCKAGNNTEKATLCINGFYCADSQCFVVSRNAYKMIIFAHSKCKRYENRKIQGVALPEKERNGQEWKSSHHGTHHGEQDYGAVLLQVVLHSIALESSVPADWRGKEMPLFPLLSTNRVRIDPSPSARCSV